MPNDTTSKVNFVFVFSVCKNGGALQLHEQTMLIQGPAGQPTHKVINELDRAFMIAFYSQFPDDMLLGYQSYSDDKTFRYSTYGCVLPVAWG